MQLHSILDKTDIINQLVKEDAVENSQLVKIAKQLEHIAHELIESCMEPEAAPLKPKTKPRDFSLDDLRTMAKMRIDTDGNMDAVKAALAELKAEKLSALPKDQYSSFVQLLEA